METQNDIDALLKVSSETLTFSNGKSINCICGNQYITVPDFPLRLATLNKLYFYHIYKRFLASNIVVDMVFTYTNLGITHSFRVSNWEDSFTGLMTLNVDYIPE